MSAVREYKLINKGEVTMSNDERAVGAWNSVLKAALAIPGVRVNREAYLTRELSKYVPPDVVSKAIETTPAKAGVHTPTIERIAKASIRRYKVSVSALSFIAGVPGGPFLAGTIPADMAQFFWHVLVVLQKLTYLYGWPELIQGEDELDDETALLLTVFIGVMFGSETANQALKKIAEKLAKELVTQLPKKALTKYAVYRLAKEIAKWIGIKLTKDGFAKALGKAIPVAGGVISGTVTWISFATMSKRLHKHLADLPIAKA